MISIKGLTKDFDGFRAVNDVDMNIQHGSIYGLVGTNGAGKSTILKLMSDILNPDSGQITFDGASVKDDIAVKDRIAFIPDDLSYYGSYNIREIANLYAGLYSRWNAELLNDILEEFKLDKNSKISRFSKGMCKQAVFALSLAKTPDYLLLDEPIDGLDPIMRKKVWKYIVAASADRGMTTLVSSHNLREMEGFCDTIGIIDLGEMKLERELDELSMDTYKLQISFGAQEKKPKGVYDSMDVREIRILGSVDHLIVKGEKEEILKWRNDHNPIVFDMLPLSLEEVFSYELGGRNDVTYYGLG